MKRNRNNNRRRQGPNVNRSLESTGPEVKIRGTAMQIYDKYQTLARDAQTSGDRVRAESLLQHAEHYYRLMKAQQPTPQAQPQVQSQAQPEATDNASNESAAPKPENTEDSGQGEDRPVRKRRRRPRVSESTNQPSDTAKSDEQPEAEKAGQDKASTPEVAAE